MIPRHEGQWSGISRAADGRYTLRSEPSGCATAAAPDLTMTIGYTSPFTRL
jgi:hypothetical protein